MFIINLTYKVNLNIIDENLEDHIKYLDKNFKENNFLCSGRKTPRNGGIILCNKKNKEDVMEIIKEDVFFKKDLAEFEIIQFTPSKCSDKFKTIL
ncbi:YciI family protein [Clostridium thermobutyricum]|uniref:YciI family protein n=1 Tax=Clostridium thermobutyricum TaxID=29372 RepID=UPI0018AB7BC4|nr:YciI family protein [Clostridium thermobutyricum]